MALEAAEPGAPVVVRMPYDWAPDRSAWRAEFERHYRPMGWARCRWLWCPIAGDVLLVLEPQRRA